MLNPLLPLSILPLNQTTAYISDEKIAAASVILESLGNCSTGLNKNASRCTQHVTVDFDSHGLVASVMFQVDLCKTPTHCSLITKNLLVYGVTMPNLIQGIVLPLCLLLIEVVPTLKLEIKPLKIKSMKAKTFINGVNFFRLYFKAWVPKVAQLVRAPA